MTVYERASIHRNLNLHCVSVRQHGRVVAHPAAVIATDVVLRVQPGGLRAMRAAGVRAVCAYAAAQTLEVVETVDSVSQDPRAVAVHFNPFRDSTFVLADGTPVYGAATFAMASPTGAWCIAPVLA